LGTAVRQGQLSGIAVCGSRGYLGTGEWWEQTTPTPDVEGGSSVLGSTMAFMLGQSLPYWMFCQGDSIHIVVEVFPGEFQHMSFGTLVKSHTYTGGQYFMASNPAANCMRHRHLISAGYNADSIPWSATGYSSMQTGAVYAEIETKYWGLCCQTDPTSEAETVIGIPRYSEILGVSSSRSPGFLDSLMFCSPSILTSLSPQFPLYVRRCRGSNGEFNYLGYPEGIRLLNMKTINAKQENTLGVDVWKIFPAGRVKSEEDYYAIGVPGLSFLK